ncbi:antitoxin [Saccharolobus caldissimus]|uniref:Putative antitoxin SACC_30750 n=2 Tax=Saccharolobus caldissimus TaxID=1702097 RepID=A0AAQ4CW77_9CREN|nr:antitoxin [Saccharolobus caldissimus]
MYACIYAYMPKVITISDEVYEKLSKLKGNKSFSEVINDLIEFYYENKKGRKEILHSIFGILSEEEARELEKEVEEFRKNFKMRDLDIGSS